MSSAATPTPDTNAPPLSQVSRITNVFFSPTTTFNDIKRDPSWWVAWLLISVISLILVVAIQQKVGFAQAMQNEIASNPVAAERMEKLPPDRRALQMDMIVASTKYVSYASPVMVLILNMVFAGVLMGTFNFGLGTEIGFSTSMAVVMYAFIPSSLKSLLAAISLYAGADPEGFNLRNPVATNLAFFLNRGDHPVLYSLASWVDVFGIWTVILLGIGYSCVSKAKRSTAISVVAGWYVLFALLGAGWVALMG